MKRQCQFGLVVRWLFLQETDQNACAWKHDQHAHSKDYPVLHWRHLVTARNLTPAPARNLPFLTSDIGNLVSGIRIYFMYRFAEKHDVSWTGVGSICHDISSDFEFGFDYFRIGVATKN